MKHQFILIEMKKKFLYFRIKMTVMTVVETVEGIPRHTRSADSLLA